MELWPTVSFTAALIAPIMPARPKSGTTKRTANRPEPPYILGAMTDELALPFEMGHYNLYRCLGRGGMGVVYAARDLRLDRDVAVKMIAGLSDPVSTKRFWREARAAASVSHPNVCQIFEVDEGVAGMFLAMELLEGESLEHRLERGPCSPAESLRIARDLLA